MSRYASEHERFLTSDLKAKSYRVDGGAGAPGVVLEGSCEESLGEEEAADPENGWDAIVDPTLEERDPLQQV